MYVRHAFPLPRKLHPHHLRCTVPLQWGAVLRYAVTQKMHLVDVLLQQYVAAAIPLKWVSTSPSSTYDARMAANHHPVGGRDYPRTLQEFDEFFSSEAACTDLLRRLRWPDGFPCPACNGYTAWTTARGQLRCAACQRQTFPIAGTIFESTRKPLRLWFWAMWFMTNQKFGGIALGLQRLLGPGSCQADCPCELSGLGFDGLGTVRGVP